MILGWNDAVDERGDARMRGMPCFIGVDIWDRTPPDLLYSPYIYKVDAASIEPSPLFRQDMRRIAKNSKIRDPVWAHRSHVLRGIPRSCHASDSPTTAICRIKPIMSKLFIVPESVWCSRI